jgi:hypothetical protein
MSNTSTPATKARRVNAFNTATLVSFSLTLLAGSVAVVTGLVPLRALELAQRVDLGAVLFLAPVLALVLGVVFEATRIALRQEPLPSPRRQQVVRNWSPSRGRY